MTTRNPKKYAHLLRVQFAQLPQLGKEILRRLYRPDLDKPIEKRWVAPDHLVRAKLTQDLDTAQSTLKILADRGFLRRSPTAKVYHAIDDEAVRAAVAGRTLQEVVADE